MKRTHKEVAKAILKSIIDGKEYAYGEIERKANTNWQTVRDHCDYLQLFDAIEITKDNRVKITDIGRKVLKKIG